MDIRLVKPQWRHLRAGQETMIKGTKSQVGRTSRTSAFEVLFAAARDRLQVSLVVMERQGDGCSEMNETVRLIIAITVPGSQHGRVHKPMITAAIKAITGFIMSCTLPS